MEISEYINTTFANRIFVDWLSGAEIDAAIRERIAEREAAGELTLLQKAALMGPLLYQASKSPMLAKPAAAIPPDQQAQLKAEGEAAIRDAATPAWQALQPGFFRTSWQGESQLFDAEKTVLVPPRPFRAATAWRTLAGDARWAAPEAAFRRWLLPEFEMRLGIVKRACEALTSGAAA